MHDEISEALEFPSGLAGLFFEGVNLLEQSSLFDSMFFGHGDEIAGEIVELGALGEEGMAKLVGRGGFEVDEFLTVFVMPGLAFALTRRGASCPEIGSGGDGGDGMCPLAT
jgi:hypothetical protein